MTLQLGEEYTDPPGEGRLGVLVGDTLGNCVATYTVFAKTTTSIWVSWTIVGPGIQVIKQGGGTVNGETLTITGTYDVTIDAYKSVNNNQNTSLSQIVFTIKDSEFGSVLDTATISRNSTTLIC